MSHSCEMLGGLCVLRQLESQQLRGQGPPLNRFPHNIPLFIQHSPTRNAQLHSSFHNSHFGTSHHPSIDNTAHAWRRSRQPNKTTPEGIERWDFCDAWIEADEWFSVKIRVKLHPKMDRDVWIIQTVIDAATRTCFQNGNVPQLQFELDRMAADFNLGSPPEKPHLPISSVGGASKSAVAYKGWKRLKVTHHFPLPWGRAR